MVYESTVNFTFDTICPWTYLAKKRLDKALSLVREKNPPVTFNLHYHPFQLYPSFPLTPTAKTPWYLHEKYSDSPGSMEKYVTLMRAYGVAEGISFSFEGNIQNTLPAHRVLQSVQKRFGSQVAGAVLMVLYRLYFEEERDPAGRSTLEEACREGGLEEGQVEELLAGGKDGEGARWGLSDREVQELVREQKGNGIDAVPYVVVEGRRRDFTLEGCKEVGEYVKVLESVVKECS